MDVMLGYRQKIWIITLEDLWSGKEPLKKNVISEKTNF